MTTESDRTRAFNAHGKDCAKYTERLAAGMSRGGFSEESERYQLSIVYFEHRQLEGRIVADKKCDGRCMGATGHNCECSCGGANHGIGMVA